MPPRVAKGRAYKDTTFQQLRSFYETARLGSLSAAAKSLGMAQPTVSQQVHALERQFGDKLIEQVGRGSRLTEPGKLLVELITPAVASISQLKQSYRHARGELRPKLIVATSPRTLVEDLPECVREFTQRHPRVQLVLREYRREQIPISVETGEVDLGFTGTHSTHDEDPWSYSPWLEYEPWFELDTILVTPKNHPLARKRTVRTQDLVGYPLLNSPEGIPDQYTRATLDKLGVFQDQQACIQATLAAAIYRFVEMGFGIGLTGRRRGRPVSAKVHVRDMSRYLGRQIVYLIRRRHTPLSEVALAFAQIVKTMPA
jgi:DNA-binding transcriptional LysR family regulator